MNAADADDDAPCGRVVGILDDEVEGRGAGAMGGHPHPHQMGGPPRPRQLFDPRQGKLVAVPEGPRDASMGAVGAGAEQQRGKAGKEKERREAKLR